MIDAKRSMERVFKALYFAAISGIRLQKTEFSTYLLYQ